MTAGDVRFVEIYESFYRQVYAYCRRRTPTDRVDDAVSETFLVAWRRIDDVPGGGEALPWLYRVAYRVNGHQWRGASRRRQLEKRLAAVGVDSVSPSEDYVVSRHESNQVLEAAARLSAADQEILRLAIWEELSHADSAVVLDVNVGAVKQRLSRARENLTREYNRLENRRTKSPVAQRGGGR